VVPDENPGDKLLAEVTKLDKVATLEGARLTVIV
jgi:hypothetical protein